MATHESTRPPFCIDLLYFALLGQDVRRYQPNIDTAPDLFEIWRVVLLVSERNLTTTTP
jgi:hypothetical protein